MLTPLPCPFCGESPDIGPENPEIEDSACGYVQCLNPECPAQPRVEDGETSSDDRGSQAYIEAAIRRWNEGRENLQSERNRYRCELENIVHADYRTWEPGHLNNAESFVLWAKSRARYALNPFNCA